MPIKSIVIILISFLIPSLGISQHFDPGVVEVLEEINNQKLVNAENDILCHATKALETSSYNSVSSAKNLKDCSVALCGPPSDNASIYVTNKTFKSITSKETLSKLDVLQPQMQKALNKAYATNLELISKIEQKFNSTRPFYENFNSWNEYGKSELSQRVFTPYIHTEINLDRPLKERLNVTYISPEGASNEFKDQLEVYAEIYKSFMNNNLDEALRLGLYSENELKDLVKNRITKLKDSYAVSESTLDVETKKNFNEKILFLEKNLTETGLNHPEMFTSLNYTEDLMERNTSSFKKSFSPLVCVDDEKCNKIYKDFVLQLNFNAKIAELKKKINDPEAKKEALNRCKAQVLAKIYDNSEEKKAKKIYDEVLLTINNKILPKFSSHSRKLLKKNLDNIRVNNSKPMKDSNDPIAFFGAELEKYISKKNTSEDFISDFEALSFAQNISENSDGFNAYLSENSPCSNQSDYGWDAFNKPHVNEDTKQKKGILSSFFESSPQSNLFISEFACTNEIHGKGIIAHELGHAINYIFSNNKMSSESLAFHDSLKKCVTENYISRIDQNVQIDSRTEEDLADVFSAMAFPEDKTLTFCAFLKPSVNEKSYLDLDLIGSHLDSHSSPLQRVITEAINKDVSLPISCQRAMKPYLKKLRFKKCAL